MAIMSDIDRDMAVDRFGARRVRPPLAYLIPVHPGRRRAADCEFAQVAELVDALASGASGRKVVEVRVFSWAPSSSTSLVKLLLL